MPTISQFQGIDILMRLNEHRPPHFHAKYGEHFAAIRIGTWEYQAGDLPSRVHKLVLKWGQLHEQELRENWERAERGELPNKIQGL